MARPDDGVTNICSELRAV